MEGVCKHRPSRMQPTNRKGFDPLTLTNENRLRMKQIIVEYGVVRKLCEEFHTSRVTVGSALRLRTNTALACKIRQRALQLGGVMMEAERVRKEGAACI